MLGTVSKRPSVPPRLGFYTVAEARYFVGLVGLINSLRAVGHYEPIIVGDCGLASDQRRCLDGHVTLVDVATSQVPHHVKTVAPLAHPSDVMVLIDADIVVTRSLNDLIEIARLGKAVAFADQVAHRFDPRWGELLELGPLPQRTYVNAGLVIVPRSIGIALLEEVEAGCARVDIDRTIVRHGRASDPFYYVDQDVLNAVLASRPLTQLDVLEHALAPFPPFPGVFLTDETPVSCAYADGRRPFALHHVLRKPWLEPTRWSAYSRLLSRVLLAPDAAIVLPEDMLPRQFRHGALAWLERRRGDGLWFLEHSETRLRLIARSVIAARRGKSTSRRTTILRDHRLEE